ncbi:hypothetical protein DDN75_09910 [Vibrio cholerae]|nr:hypothetical protein [Vibrio cholerae]
MVQVIGRFRASILRGLPLVKVGLFSGKIYHRFVAQTWKGAFSCRIPLSHLLDTTFKHPIITLNNASPATNTYHNYI